MDRDDTVRKAEKLLRQGDLAAAITEYARVAESHPHDLPTLNKLGELYQRAGQTGDAIAQFTRVADQWLREGLYPKAAAHYKKILKLHPQDESAMLQLAQASIRQGLIEDAKAYLRTARAGREARGDRAGADDLTLKLSDLDPTDFDARLTALRVRLGREPSPELVADVRGLIAELERQGRSEETETLLASLIRLDPDDVDTRVRVARAAMRRGDLTAARAALPMETAGSDRYEVIALAAELELTAGNIEAGRPLLQRMLAVNREHAIVEIVSLGDRLRAYDRVSDGVRGGARGDVPDGGRGGAHGDVHESTTTGVHGGVHSGVPRGVQSGVRSGVRGGMHSGVDADAAEPRMTLALHVSYVCVESLVEHHAEAREFTEAAARLTRFLGQSPRHVPALLRLVEICVDGDLDAEATSASGQLADAYLQLGDATKARVIAEDLLIRDPRSRTQRHRLRRTLVALGEAHPDAIITDIVVEQLGTDDLDDVDDVDDLDDLDALDDVGDVRDIPDVRGVRDVEGEADKACTDSADKGDEQEPGREVWSDAEAKAQMAFAGALITASVTASARTSEFGSEVEAPDKATSIGAAGEGAVAEAIGAVAAGSREDTAPRDLFAAAASGGDWGPEAAANAAFGAACGADDVEPVGGDGVRAPDQNGDPDEPDFDGGVGIEPATGCDPLDTPEPAWSSESSLLCEPLDLAQWDHPAAGDEASAPSGTRSASGSSSSPSRWTLMPSAFAAAGPVSSTAVEPPPPATVSSDGGSGAAPFYGASQAAGLNGARARVDRAGEGARADDAIDPADRIAARAGRRGLGQGGRREVERDAPTVDGARDGAGDLAGDIADEIDLTGALNALAQSGMSISEALDAAAPGLADTGPGAGAGPALPRSYGRDVSGFDPAGGERVAAAGGPAAAAAMVPTSAANAGTPSRTGERAAGDASAGDDGAGDVLAGDGAEADLEQVFDGLRARAAGDMVDMAQPDQSARLLSMAETYQAAGMYEEARAALEQVANDSRHRFRAAAALGQLFWQQGDADAALRWLELASEAPAPDPDAGRVLMYELAEKLERTGETTRALAVFLDLLAEQDDYRDVRARVDRLMRVQAEP